ncbi:MAG: hypothetical protein WEA04_00265 [Candidatus Andersenbacteria bacterium]
MFTAAAITVFLPLLLFIIPGLSMVRPVALSPLSLLTQTVLWSVSLWIIILFATALIGLPNTWTIALVTATAGIIVGQNRHAWQGLLWPRPLLLIIIGVTIYALFGTMYVANHDALPSGDSQKAILWATEINTTSRLPDYSVAPALLNRDPVDFYTPGLHVLIAALLQLAPHPVIAVGFFSIAASLAVVLIATASAIKLFPELPRWSLAITCALLILTNFRFLRYLREPGYHLQNIVGELLLFGLLYIGILLWQEWRWRNIVLAALLSIALVISHQFSAFLAIFILLPLTVAMGLRYLSFHQWHRHLKHSRGLVALLLLLIIMWVSLALNLHQKIPHIFTFDAHLRGLVPAVAEYPRIIGEVWLYAGIAGLVHMLLVISNWHRGGDRLLFAISTFIILLMSRGPYIGIDIPPVRALFYAVVPLSLAAAYFFETLRAAVRQFLPAAAVAASAIIFSLILINGAVTATQAFQIVPIRTTSTLTPAQQALITYLESQPEQAAILIDDYNQRANSWLLLAQKPLYARLAAELAIQMDEAEQSSLRSALYLAQLNFEKIFALGSLPEILPLLHQYNINWVTGINKSSNSSFAHNPILAPVYQAGDTVLYTIRPPEAAKATSTSPHTDWLLKTSTLANDIGDNEDTFAHLPASLHTSRLSAPRFNGQRTYRVTSAPRIALRFNIGDFATRLWDQDHTNQADTTVELLLEFLQPVPDLVLETTTGHQEAVTAATQILRLSPAQVPFAPDGFITVYLLNPHQRLVEIDLIALGLSRVP